MNFGGEWFLPFFMDDEKEVSLVLDSILVQQQVCCDRCSTRVHIGNRDDHSSVSLEESELLPVACALIEARIFARKRKYQ